MKRETIIVVVGDIGGTNAVLPVIARLKEAGHDVTIIADRAGKGKNVLEKAGITYSLYAQGRIPEEPSLVLVGTSATAYEAQVGITHRFKTECPVVWLEDFWGTASVPDLRHSGETPDYLLTLDEASLGLGGRSSKRIATGNPAFDRLASWNVAEIRTRVRKAMGIAEDVKVISYFGPGYNKSCPARVFESLALLFKDLMSTQATFMPFLHPKDETLTEGMEAMFRVWEADSAKAPFPVRLDGRVYVNDTTELVCLSDVVASPNSTELLSACLLEVPAIALMGPQSLQYVRDCGLRRLPCCENEAVLEITPDSKPPFLGDILGGELGKTCTSHQRQFYPNDGKATERVFDAIVQILGN